MKYKGTYVSPETDDVDARNQKELNFSLEEAKMIAEINPQMLSLRELYTVALSYTEDKARFYKIINISVKLYPVHPVANLNAAAAAIEQGTSNRQVNSFQWLFTTVWPIKTAAEYTN